MNSLPSVDEITIEFENTKLFMTNLAEVDPGLWRIKQYLMQYDVNPELLPIYIEHLGRINESGYGKIITEIRDHRVIFCEGVDSRLLNLEI